MIVNSTPIGDPEALQYARDLGGTLVAAGWQLTHAVGTSMIMAE